jgi:predicted MFS family arabinose efflux permease
VINGGIWAPLIVLFLLRAVQTSRPWSNAALAGLFLGIAWLSGHHEIPILLTPMSLLLWGWFSLRTPRLVFPAALFLLTMFLIGAVQCINILDFMMVMPLGPDFAKMLGIATSKLGWVGGIYGAAAAFSGVFLSRWLDQFDRKKALLITLTGLFLATLLGALAVDFSTLLITRIIAGACGGPASAVAYAIIADIIPLERRGQAIGKVMGAFSVAAVVGVPLCLEIATYGGWRAPFIIIFGLGLVVLEMARRWLPPMKGHIGKYPTLTLLAIAKVWSRMRYSLSFLTIFCAMMAGFMIIPNIAAYLQFNLHYPREQLGSLYMVGGIISFIMLRFAGRAIDRIGGFWVNFIGSTVVMFTMIGGFAMVPPWFNPMVLFALFMFGMALRNVSNQTMVSKVPAMHERAGFMSMISATTHIASATGAFIASQILVVGPDQHQLVHMDRVAYSAAVLTMLVPFFLRMVEKRPS